MPKINNILLGVISRKVQKMHIAISKKMSFLEKGVKTHQKQQAKGIRGGNYEIAKH